MSRETAPIRAVTWNVHKCVGRRGRFDPASIVTRLKDLGPDILAVQEVDSRGSVAGGLDTFAYLADSLGLFALDARTLRTPDGDYGHMLMSRWRLDAGAHHDLTVGTREPRHAISCEIRAFGPPLWVLAAHLGLRGRERQAQIERIRQLADRGPAGPALILGDFNEWRYPGAASRSLCPPFRPMARLPSYPSARPFLPLDRIWYREPLSLRRAWLETGGRAESDHLPVVAELQMPSERFSTAIGKKEQRLKAAPTNLEAERDDNELMRRDEAEASLRAFLMKMYDDSRRFGGY